MMCATMVLGSSAVAFAAPSNDDYSNAKKIFSNSKNFTNELFKENATVKETVWVKSVQTNVTFGFDADTMKAVKLNDDNKALKYVGDAKDLTVGYPAVNGSVTVQSVVDAYVAANHLDSAATVAQLGLSKIAYVFTDTQNLSHVIIADLAGTGAAATATTVDSVSATIKIAAGTVTKADYMTADGYSYDVDSDVTLFSADEKNVTGSGIKCVKYETASTLTKYIPTLAKALENGTITKNAVAVKLSAYSVVGNKDAAATADDYLRLQSVTTPTAGYTVTSLSDLLSRTSLKDSVNIFKFNEESPVTDYEMGASIYPISTVASNVSVSDSKFTFDVTFTGDDNIIIFDQASDASANDGAADKTTTSTSSPKTGDVAPIAALAVVMMGACGAMVVASKKRA